MKLAVISDLFISSSTMLNGLKSLEPFGVDISCIHWDIDDIAVLQNINLLIEKQGSEAYEPPKEIIEKCTDAEIILTHFCPITQKFIDACPKLKIIGVLRGGTENINVEYASQKNILCMNTPGRTSNAVADFTVGMIMAETRNIARGHRNLKAGNWQREYANKDCVPGMLGRTVGIVGFGEIGRKVAQRLQGFEVKTLAYDPYVKPEDTAALGVRLVSLDELMSASDIVTVHARLTADTQHMIGEHEISLMKPTAILVNTARAGLVDEKALYKALAEKKIMGAALDVFEVEPTPVDYPIVLLDNVTITPHLAGSTIDTMANSPRLFAQNLQAYFNGKFPRGSINSGKIDFQLKKS